MKDSQELSLVEKLLANLEELLPVFMEIPEDKAISNGGAAVCIIDEEGRIFGSRYCDDPRCKTREYPSTAY